MILIKNTQKKIDIDINAIKKDVRTILDLLGYSDFDIGIWFTTNPTIRKYNKEYREKDKATDVLSFPYHETVNPGEKIIPETDEDKNLGDLIISLEYAQQDAEDWNHTFNEHVRFLLVHGICHLLGYDHIEDTDYAVMNKKEQFLLKQLKNN
jgi:rRNA maturation RNase YbeY